MTVKQYDRVLLKDGNEASIVEIFEEDKLFLADIDRNGDTDTEELRIEEIEKILKNAEVIDEDDVALDTISVGCCVTLLDVEFDDEMKFKIVGSTEANSLKGYISNESPIGQALLGKKKGEVVEVESPAGAIQYKIMEIERSI